MATLKESAMEYQPPQTLNIADLEYVSVNVEVIKETHTKKDGEEFDVNVVEVSGKKYRVPNTVLEQIKMIVDKFPDTTHITVGKIGSGMSTKYTVMPHAGPKNVVA